MTAPASIGDSQTTSNSAMPAWRPASILVLASLIYALAPVVVHETAEKTNPFYYNGLARIVQIALLFIFLCYGKRRYFDAFFLNKEINKHRLERKHAADITFPHEEGECLHCGNEAALPADREDGIGTRIDDASQYAAATRPPRLRLDDHLAFFRTSRCSHCSHPIKVSIRSFRERSRFRDLLRIPLIWSCIGTFDYALFAWSAQHTETAIASTAFELWPLLLISFMALHEKRNELYRKKFNSVAHQKKIVSGKNIVLMIVAAVGLIFILESQYDNGASLILAQRSFGDIAGGLLAIGGAALAALTICDSLVYGKLLYSRLMENTRDGVPQEPIGKLDISHQRLVLWLTMMGHLVAKTCSLPLLFVVGALDFSRSSTVGPRGVLGAVLLGCVLGGGSILLRKGNVDSLNPATNSLMLLSPLAALFFLSIAGIELPRMELFAVGAALIIATNVLIQTKPDESKTVSGSVRQI